MKDLKILNARIPCFETNDWETADILINDGIIAKVGTVSEDTKKTIDADGSIVSPGFIDIHAHEDPVHAGAYNFFTAKRELLMGVTTKIAGNCGDNYDDLRVFCSNIAQKGSPTNYMMFIGQNYLRAKAGADDRYKPSTRMQMEKMKKMLQENRRYAPVGLSCGFEYAPGVTTEETIELLKAFDEEGFLTSAHFRSDGENCTESVKELVQISEATGYGIQMSHIGSCCAIGYMTEGLQAIDKARIRGVDITADCYPYNAFCTGIGTAVFDEGCFEKWNKSYEDIQITAGEYKNQRCSKELFEKLRKESPELYVTAFVMNEEEILQAYAKPYVMVGSDCGFVEGCGHPRGAGAFPRVLSRYVREKKAMSLMEALRKMTVLPADRVNLQAKGDIKEGKDADIVIFDKDKIRDRSDFDCPTEPPEGIKYVLVAGQAAVEHNRIVNDTLGRYIPYQNRL